MDFFEAQDFFKSMHPGKNISFEFDDKCLRAIECICSESNPHIINHVVFNKVKVLVQEQDPIYVPIANHRSNMHWAGVKRFVNSRKDAYIPNEELDLICRLQDEKSGHGDDARREELINRYAQYMESLVSASGLTQAEIEEKAEKHRQKVK
jgi:hypothetical protein